MDGTAQGGAAEMARTIALTAEAEAFRAQDGQEIIYLSIPVEGTVSEGDVLYSPDGRNYHALSGSVYRNGASTGSVEHTLHFEDATTGRRARWLRSGDQVVFDEVTFSKVITPREVAVSEPGRLPEYLFRLRDGRLIYVDADRYSDSYYETFRLFIGDSKMMRRVPVTGVQRMRNGEVRVFTAEASLYSPPDKYARKLGQKPTWNGQDLEELDPSQFSISESRDGVAIDPR
jgi:hypothetical protein